ncbi:MAG: hypothetical protein U0269_11150 [Polyangiales bacterium]
MRISASLWLAFASLSACAPRDAPRDAAEDQRADNVAIDVGSEVSVDASIAVIDASSPSDVVADASDAASDAVEAGRDRSRDITLRWLAAASHPDRLVEARLIDDRDTPLALVVLRGFSATESLPLRSVLPSGPARFDWFVDRSGDGLYQPPPTDDSSRTAVPVAIGPVVVELRESSPSVDISRAAPSSRTLFGRFTEFEPHPGVFFQLEIEPEGRDETVALFRVRALPAVGHFDFALRGVLVAGQRYTARWFIDLNDNEVYDPRGDHGGSLSFAVADADLTLVHEHHANRAWVE